MKNNYQRFTRSTYEKKEQKEGEQVDQDEYEVNVVDEKTSF